MTTSAASATGYVALLQPGAQVASTTGYIALTKPAGEIASITAYLALTVTGAAGRRRQFING